MSAEVNGVLTSITPNAPLAIAETFGCWSGALALYTQLYHFVCKKISVDK